MSMLIGAKIHDYLADTKVGKAVSRVVGRFGNRKATSIEGENHNTSKTTGDKGSTKLLCKMKVATTPKDRIKLAATHKNQGERKVMVMASLLDGNRSEFIDALKSTKVKNVLKKDFNIHLDDEFIKKIDVFLEKSQSEGDKVGVQELATLFGTSPENINDAIAALSEMNANK